MIDFTYSQDSEYNRPCHKKIAQWKHNCLNYCKFVSSISYNGEIKTKKATCFLPIKQITIH